MSFFYQTSAAAARTRRTKERDAHPRASSMSTTGRRHRASSKSQDNRSPPPKSPNLSASIYSQQNLALDQLPASASTEVTDMGSAPSTLAQASNSSRNTAIQLSQEIYTPASLRQYLDDDSEHDNEDELQVNAYSEGRGGALGCSDQDNMTTNVSSDAFGVQVPYIEQDGTSRYSDTYPIHPDQIASAGGKDAIQLKDIQSQQDSALTIMPGSFEVYPSPTSGTGSDRDQDVPSNNRKNSMHSVEPQDKAVSRTMQQVKRRPYSQMISKVDLQDLTDIPGERHSAMVRSSSQQSAPLLSRAFTPPAPPLGVSRAPAQTAATHTPPVYMSPKPIRSHTYTDNYAGYYSPAYSQARYPTQQVPYEHYNFPPPPQFSNAVYPTYPAVTDGTMQYPVSPHSVASELVKTRSLSTEHISEDPVTLLTKISSALPHMQQLIGYSQPAPVSATGNLERGAQTDIHSYASHGSLAKIQESDRTYSEQTVDHAEEVRMLKEQMNEIRARAQYLEADLLSRKKSRDNLREDLIVLRVESAAAAKILLNEKLELEQRLESVKLSSAMEYEAKLEKVTTELTAKTNLVDDLRLQLSELEASHRCAQKASITFHEDRYSALLQEHKETIQDLRRQIKGEQDRYSVMARTNEELQHKLKEEQARLRAEIEVDKARLEKKHKDEEARLLSSLEAETRERSRAQDESASLHKEMSSIRHRAEKNESKYIKIISDSRTAVKHMHRENARKPTQRRYKR